MTGHDEDGTKRRAGTATSAVLFCLIAGFALSACSKKSDDQAASAAPTPAAAVAVSETPIAAPSEVAGDDPHHLPSAIQGRWAMVPADCDEGRGDAKGLLIVDGTTLKFYESRAVLATFREREDKHIRGSFTFSGEGQTWKQDMVLDAKADGKTLVRRDYGPDAMPGALEYTRCGDDDKA